MNRTQATIGGMGVLGLPALAGVLMILVGCAAPGPRSAATQPAVPTDSNAALMAYLADQPYVTAEPAYRAVHILWRGEVFQGDFDELAETLRAAGIVKADWHHRPDTLLDRGTVGYLLCKAGGIETGLNWRLTGWGRYAWRELNYLGIATPPSEYGYVPGGQFVGMLALTEDHLRRTRAGEPGPVELGEPPRPQPGG